MARTRASRGGKPFKMRSGNNLKTGTPYPFLGKIGKALGGGLLGKVFGKGGGPGMGVNKAGGIVGSLAGDAAAGGDTGAAAEQLEAIKAIVSDEDSPMSSRFKHADSGHSEEDHQHVQQPAEEKKPESGDGMAPFDVQRELDYVNRQMQHGNNAKNPYYTNRKAQLEAYLAGEGTLKGYQRATP